MNSPDRKIVVRILRADRASRIAAAPRSEDPPSKDTTISGRSPGPRVRIGRGGAGRQGGGRGRLHQDGRRGCRDWRGGPGRRDAECGGGARRRGRRRRRRRETRGEESGDRAHPKRPLLANPVEHETPVSTGAAPRKREPEKRNTAVPEVDEPSSRSPPGVPTMESSRAVGASRRGRASGGGTFKPSSWRTVRSASETGAAAASITASTASAGRDRRRQDLRAPGATRRAARRRAHTAPSSTGARASGPRTAGRSASGRNGSSCGRAGRSASDRGRSRRPLCG